MFGPDAGRSRHRSSMRPALALARRYEALLRAALFLSSDEASYITGAELAVDGGMSAAL